MTSRKTREQAAIVASKCASNQWGCGWHPNDDEDPRLMALASRAAQVAEQYRPPGTSWSWIDERWALAASLLMNGEIE